MAMLPLLLLVSCTSGPGSKEEFVEVLTADDGLEANQAQCIADRVFDRYSANEDALGRLSSATDLGELEGEEGLEGFNEFYDDVVDACKPFADQAGSSSDSEAGN